jgi:hypothetical protein
LISFVLPRNEIEDQGESPLEPSEQENSLLLVPNYRQWAVRQSLPLDPALTDSAAAPAVKWPLSSRDKDDKTFFDYFCLMYPMNGLAQTVASTSQNLEQRSKKPTSTGEFLRFLGLRLAMCATPIRGGIRAYWDRRTIVGSVTPALDFQARFGMSYHRFENLTQCLQFAPPMTTSSASNEVIL